MTSASLPPHTLALDQDRCFAAVRARDPYFDGRFFAADHSGVRFCRPVCPTRTSRREHLIFFPSAAAALRAGFRPCLRCRPEIACERPLGESAREARAFIDAALGLMTGRAGIGLPFEAVAARLGVTDTHLHGLFVHHLDASPDEAVRTQRLLLAKQLITDTGRSLADVALAAGFDSARQLDASIRRTFGCAPSALRRRGSSVSDGWPVRLACTVPYRWDALLGFVGPRAFPGVEAVLKGRYRRVFGVQSRSAALAARLSGSGTTLALSLDLDDPRALPALVERARRYFDVAADAPAIAAHLGADPVLRPVVRRLAGWRIPGAWDAFELAVRAILGQQVSVKAASTLAARIVAAHGEPVGNHPLLNRVFPTPEALRRADLTRLGVVGARARAINGLASILAQDGGLFDRLVGLDRSIGELTRLPGIGPWTAHYIAMRALREPDAFPESDLGLVRAYGRLARRTTTVRELARAAERWRPWRAYAAMLLWMSEPLGGG